jgi:hypothetical protein
VVVVPVQAGRHVGGTMGGAGVGSARRHSRSAAWMKRSALGRRADGGPGVRKRADVGQDGPALGVVEGSAGHDPLDAHADLRAAGGGAGEEGGAWQHARPAGSRHGRAARRRRRRRAGASSRRRALSVMRWPVSAIRPSFLLSRWMNSAAPCASAGARNCSTWPQDAAPVPCGAAGPRVPQDGTVEGQRCDDAALFEAPPRTWSCASDRTARRRRAVCPTGSGP